MFIHMLSNTLEKVIFLLADEEQIKPARKMREKMKKDREKIVLYKIEKSIDQCRHQNAAHAICPGSGILYVTDSEKTAKELHQEDCPVAALLHEKNKEEVFAGIPYAIMHVEEQTFDSLEKAYLRLTGQPWTIMETERCIIRETTVEDVEAFYRIYAEPSITYYMEDLFPEPEEEKAYAREYMEKVYSFYGYGMWSIVNKENGEVIGRAGLSWREGFAIPELGFLIGVPYQRKGYAYEVCRAIVDYGKEELEFERIQALVKKANVASVCLCEKLGFTYMDTVENEGEVYERYVG